jgi:hypothetical protein
MEPDALDTLDAIMAGLHTLAGHAETVEDEQLRNRLTGAVVGLRAAVLTARGQVTHLRQQIAQLQTESRTYEGEPARRPIRGPQPRLKWGCYQFDDTEGLFCTACWDQRQRRIRTMRYNNENLVCPNCRMLFPFR